MQVWDGRLGAACGKGLRRAAGLWLGAIAAVVALAASAAPAEASTYVTLQLARSQYASVGATCERTADTVTLPGVVTDLAARGRRATVVVQLSQIAESQRICKGGIQYASWDDLEALHGTYGLEAVSAGDVIVDFRTLSDADVRAHSCDTLPPFAAHGFTRAWGEFAFPGSLSDTRTRTLVAECFAWSRRYGSKPNPLPVAAPYNVIAYSLNGGRCADAAAPCAAMTLPSPYPYTDPQLVIDMINRTPDNAWFVFQAYRFVKGSSAQWDCTSPDWRRHWVAREEMYCYGDYLRIVNKLRSDLVVTDPAGVAEAVGRAADITGASGPAALPLAG